MVVVGRYTDVSTVLVVGFTMSTASGTAAGLEVVPVPVTPMRSTARLDTAKAEGAVEGVVVAVAVAEAEGVMVREAVLEKDEVRVGVGEMDSEGEMEAVLEDEGDSEGVGEIERVGVTERVAVMERVTEMEALGVVEMVEEAVTEGDTEATTDSEAVMEVVGVRDTERVGVTEEETDAEGVMVKLVVGEVVGDTEAEGVIVVVTEVEGVLEGVTEAVTEVEGVTLGLGEAHMSWLAAVVESRTGTSAMERNTPNPEAGLVAMTDVVEAATARRYTLEADVAYSTKPPTTLLGRLAPSQRPVRPVMTTVGSASRDSARFSLQVLPLRVYWNTWPAV